MNFQTFINNIFIGAENVFNFIKITFININSNNYFRLLLCILFFGIIIWIILLILETIMHIFDNKFKNYQKEYQKEQKKKNLKEHE